MLAGMAAPPSSDWQSLLRLIPGYDPFRAPGGAWFDADAASRALAFFPECLRHVEGAMAGRPFALEPWQQAVVGNLFGWKKKDRLGRIIRRYREVLIYVPRKSGKALALDTPLPTPAGWTTMGEVRVGDVLFDERGCPCRVTHVAGVQHGNPCYEVCFSDGTSVVADEEHLWMTDARSDRDRLKGRGGKNAGPKPSLKTTGQIRATLLVRGERNHRIPLAAPLCLPDASFLIDPYVLGCWLGDGHSADARLTVSRDEPELLANITACGVTLGPARQDARSRADKHRLGGRPRLTCRRGHPRQIHWRNGHCRACEREGDRARRRGAEPAPWTEFSFQEHLRALGVLGNKHIPSQYLRGSAAQRQALLQGLMDTDGHVSKGGECEYTTTSSQLRDGFLELARSLGYKPGLTEGRAVVNGKDCGPKYRIRFFAYRGRAACRLGRKAARLKPQPAKPTRASARQVVAVRPVPSAPVRCIAVDSLSHLYLAGSGMVPTHNTPLAAGIALYVFFCDGERGQQGFVAAGDREQAALLFRQAKGMVEQEPELARRCKVYGGHGAGGQSRSLVREADGSFLRVISADADTKHGGNTHLAIVDELHAQPDRDLVDVLTTSMASQNRAQPLLIFITTADFNRPSICNEKHDYACKVRDGIIEDPSFLPVIYEAQNDEDWTSPAVWAKANPNLGVSVSAEYLERECKKAREIPAYENTFKRLHLNMKTETDVRALPMEAWDACGGVPVDPDALKGRECFAGLDLSNTTDLSALVLVFPEGDGRYSVLAYCWAPRENARQRERRDRVPYETWARQGFLKLTEGNVIDYDVIRADINELGKQFFIREIAADRWNSTQLLTQLAGDGFEVVAYGQGFKDMTAPTKELLKLVVSGKLAHGGQALLRWTASNLATETDAAGNLKPSKKKSTERIDPMVALVMGLGRALLQADPDGWYRPGILRD